VAVGAEDLLKMYYYLRLARGLEDQVTKLYRQGKVVGGCYVGTGEEAISVGSAYALEPHDVIAPSHRDLGAHLVKGVLPKEYMAQYLGRRTALTKGKDGNIHFGDLERGIIGFISPMADGIPVAAGAALAFKIRREPRIAVAYFGDGASSRGDFHEGLNLAAVLKLPVLFICHNNQYAYSVPLSRQMAVPHVADRAKAYGFPTMIVDGNDILAPQRFRELVRLRHPFGIEHDLRHAMAVAQVDKDHTAMIAPSLDPAIERDGLPRLVAG